LLYVYIDISVLSQYLIICKKKKKTSILDSLDSVSLIDALKSRYHIKDATQSYSINRSKQNVTKIISIILDVSGTLGLK
jgi:hypothetical protein